MQIAVKTSLAPYRLWLAMTEPLLVAAAVPLLLFPRDSLPWVGFGLILLGWALRSLGTVSYVVATPLDRSIVLILLMTLVGLYRSSDLTLSLPKFYVIILGLFIYYSTVGNIHSERRFWLGTYLLIASIIAISILGLVGTEWNADKYPVLRQTYDGIPRLIRGIDASVGPAAGFHPNELGGTLAILLPLPISLLVRLPLTTPQKGFLACTLLLGLYVLLLSASRTALICLVVAVLGLLVLERRRTGLVVLIIATAALSIALAVDAPAVGDFFLQADESSVAPGERSLPYRLAVWGRAISVIEDYPFTGIGLNAFPAVVGTLYPNPSGLPVGRIPHAHNIFLQTTLDLGFGGLLAFLAIWLRTALVGFKAYRLASQNANSTTPLQAAIAGLLVGSLTYLTFGLTDAIALGAKPTILLWLMAGLLISAERLGPSRVGGSGAAAVIRSSRCPASFVPPQRILDASRSVRQAMTAAYPTWRDAYWRVAYASVVLGYIFGLLGDLGYKP